MLFRRSEFRPFAADATGRATRRRLWRFSLSRAALFAIVAAIIAGLAADRSWIRGNGIVAGELTAVAPIVQARLKRVFVTCLDHVVRGQRLAELENEATVEAAAQQLQQLRLELTQVQAEVDVADRESEAARKLVDAQVALLNQLISVLKAQDELVKKQNVAQLIWEKAKADVARADAEARAAQFVYETKRADQKKAELAVGVLQQRIDSFMNSPELTGDFYLTAPKDGVVTECSARPGEVIAVKTPIFQIFNPDDSYAVVFFDPGDVTKLIPGQPFTIKVGGLGEPVTGQITGFYPELSALPNSLTRYFWQQEKWSQYAPVRLDFDHLTPVEKSRLLAWAQLSASRWEGWDLSRTALWQWVWRQCDEVRRLATLVTEQKAVD
jgi:membrane fusion protein, multidrug efflux system